MLAHTTDPDKFPGDAIPFVRELVFEILRRLPPSLGTPPQLNPGPLDDSRSCGAAVTTLLQWLESSGGAVEQRMEEFGEIFVSLREVADKTHVSIRKAVLRNRSWAEEEMAFAHTVREVLESVRAPLQDAAPDTASRELLDSLLDQIATKLDRDRKEVLSVSDEFDTVQRNLVSLREQVEVLERRTRQLRDDSLRDALTGLWNRRAFDQRLVEECSRVERYGGDFSIALWSLDGIQELNRRHGHRSGDALLQSVSGRVLAALRRSDFVARYTGASFAVLFPGTPQAQAALAGNKIRAAVAGEPFQTTAGLLPVTVSVGVTGYTIGDNGAELIGRAQNALGTARETSSLSPAPPA